MPCPDVFVQDVPASLARKGMTWACYMDPSRPAALDPALAVRVNHETYLFADSAARERFREDVVRYCGLLTDPVSKRRFRPTQDSPGATDPETDVDYWFEDEETRDAFVADPAAYRLPGWRM